MLTFIFGAIGRYRVMVDSELQTEVKEQSIMNLCIFLARYVDTDSRNPFIRIGHSSTVS